jgi:hypothetical protein
MSFIRAWVNGHPISSETLHINGRFYNIGIIAPATISQCGNFINIH